MTPEEVEAAVGRAIDQKLGQFYVDRETHYRDHVFLQAFRRWTEEAKGTVLRAVLKTFVAVCFFLMLAGFIMWGKGHFGK